MKKLLRFISLLLIFSGLALSRLSAQTFGSEAELKEQAAKLFDDDQFEEAFPLYAQLASIYNKDPNINYRLGVCMLYASEDKEKPIPFLELASKYPDVEKEVFFYLAKAYHLNYRFDDAIKQYQAYQKIASGPKSEKLQVAHQIEMCKNGKKLLRNISDLIVIDKKEMSRTDFYRSYDITAIGGKLLAKPDEETFKTPIDKKKKETSIIYFSSDNNQIYFASYGDDVTHGKDIYLVRKLPNGELSKPQTLGYPVNTEYDEDFPFLHPNGKVLYFCSKGHNSMGGYDIFKTTLNELTNTWNKPVNLDFPINSPDDDILYITNSDEKEAYFSSARSSATGKTAVYHINVERKPIETTIINGSIVKNSPDQDMNVKITVKNLDDNEILGIFNSDPQTGNFSMNFPSGGKVMYTVESPGFPTQSEVINIPSQASLTPLKQEISFEAGTGKLSVKNRFDEPGSDENYLSAINLIKEKSKMEVNVNEVAAENFKTNGTSEETTSGDKSSGTKKGTKPTNLSNDEIVKIAYSDAKDVEKEAKELKDQADIALVIANQKNEEAQSKARDAAKLTSDAAQISDPAKKQTAQEQVNTANKEVGELNQLTVTSYNVAKALEMKADAKQKEAELSMQYAKDLEAAVKSKSSAEALAKLDEQQKKLEAISQKNDASATISNSLKLDAENKKRELDKAVQTSTDIKQEIADNETAIATTETDMAKEKNDNIKQGMKDQIQGLKDDIISGKKELETSELKVAQLQKEYNGINNQIELFNSVVDKAKTGNNEAVNATAAAIDKTKLEQQVNTLKNSDNSLASIKPITSDGGGTTASDKQKVIPELAKGKATTGKTPVKQAETDKEKNTENKTVGSDVTQTPTSTKTEEKVVGVETPNKSTDLTDTEKKPTEPAIDKTFEDALSATASISNPVEKETKKAEIYENWSAAIQQELDVQKGLLQKETEPEKKTALTSDITILEKKLSETQQSKTQAVATAEKLKTEQAVVSNTEKETITNNQNTVTPAKTETVPATDEIAKTDSPPAVDRNNVKENVSPAESSEKLVAATPQTTQQLTAFEQAFKQEVADAEQITTAQEKETRKSKAAKNYVNSVALLLNSKKSDLKAEKDTEKQKELNQDIAILEKNIAEKQKIADESNAKITTTATSDADKGQLTDVTVTTQTKPETENTGKSAKEISTPVVKNIVETKQPFTYSNTTAKNNLDKAATLDKEADGLLQESNKIKEQAALQNDVTEKNNLYNKAGELTTSAESKKLEAAQLIGTANAMEYRNNQHLVDQYANSNKGSADELAIADLMKDEAKTYFDKAQNSRKAAISFETYYAKQTALDDANKNEQLALQKQNNALAIYKRNNPKLVAQPLTAADLAAKPVVKETTPTTTTPVSDKSVTASNPAVKQKEPSNKEETTTTTTTTTQPVVTTQKTDVSPDNKESVKEDISVNKESKDAKEKPVSDVTVNENKESAQDKTITPDQPAVTNSATSAVKDNPVVDKTVTSADTENKKETITTPDQPTVVADKTVAVTKPATAKTKTKFSLRELFEKRNRSRYSASNPIPLDEKLPDGLIFKVQMGAFKNAIPQDLFKGISPVTGQTTPQGFIRYSAGLFLTCETAEKAKLEIRGLGFPDAFVVAYFDGKRIPSPCGVEGTTVATTTTADEKTVTPDQPIVTPEPAVTNPPVVTTKTETIPATNVEIVPTTDVATLSGLFYTIQVGVYSKPITGSELFNIQPLYTENANNLIRYNVGIYNSIPLASEAKKIAVGAGLKDAFMTIYYNGKRISMVEAATLTAQGVTTLSSAPGLNQLPTFKNGGVLQNNSPAVNTVPSTQPVRKTTQTGTVDRDPPKTGNETPVVKPTVTAQPQTREIEPGIVFKVQIGAFNEEVPLETANKFLKISKKGIKNYKDEKGTTIYTVGNYATYEEADRSRQEVASEGLPDAFIVAYSDGKKISVEEAQKLTGKK